MKRASPFLSIGGTNTPSVVITPRARRIANASIPAFALIPMVQHSGNPARCLVRPGDRVQEGMRIGEADGIRSAHVHSSIPGTVVRVEQTVGPDGTPCTAALIEFGGEFERTGKPRKPEDWQKLSRADLLARIRSCGVVGLGGSLVPTHVKLARDPAHPPAVLIANGLDCEPCLVADSSLMAEKSREIATGMGICQRVLGTSHAVLAISQEEEPTLGPLFHEHFEQAGFKLAPLPAGYPQGHEDLVKAAVMARAGLPSANGAGSVVLNVATIFAVYEAVVMDRPMIERTITVCGSAVRQPTVLKARIGTRIGDLFEDCGGLMEEPGKVVLGGPMRGTAVSSLDFPVTKGVSGVIAYTRAEARADPRMPCIRCGACVEACPWGLVPTRLHKLIEKGEIAAALAEGLASCTECGCCAFACPSRIPLVESLRLGKRLGTGPRHG